jgi:RNA polymerase sigma-70 factor (sigma-E family)
MGVTPRRSATPGGYRGQVDHFRDFAEAESPGLLRAAYLFLGDTASAEDALQTTLMRTFQNWKTASHNPAAYSRTVLTNLCRDQGRRRRLSPEEVVQRTVLPDAGVSDASQLIASREEMAQALASLPVAQREILVLRFFSDLSVPEIATTVGLPEGTVKSTINRSLAKLRQRLSTRYPAEDEEIRLA